VSEELPDAVNGWRAEASILHKRRGWEYWRAYDHILVRYLAAGHARPLLDLFLNLKRQPRRRTSEFIAAITDGKALIDQIAVISDLPPIDTRSRFRHCAAMYGIRIGERRGPGRPKAEAEDTRRNEIRLSLVCGFGDSAAGIPASNRFWFALAAALDCERYERSTGRSFPFKAELVRMDGGTGRARDPELETRDKALHAAVTKKIEGGLKYDTAVEDVRVEFEARGKAERALGKAEIGLVGSATIRAAYDKLSARQPKS
jgi:hypothetical protein